MFLRVPSAARYSCCRACCVSMLCVLYVPCLPWLGARQLRFAVDGGLDSGVGHIGCSDMLYEQFNGFPGGISALSLFYPRMVRCHWCVNFVWPNVGDGVALGCYMVCLCFFPWVFLSSRVSLSCDHGLDYASQCENNNNSNKLVRPRNPRDGQQHTILYGLLDRRAIYIYMYIFPKEGCAAD